MGEQDLAEHDKVEDKFLLIPNYFEVKAHLTNNSNIQATHKIHTKNSIKILQKIFQYLKIKTFTYGVRKS